VRLQGFRVWILVNCPRHVRLVRGVCQEPHGCLSLSGGRWASWPKEVGDKECWRKESMDMGALATTALSRLLDRVIDRIGRRRVTSDSVGRVSLIDSVTIAP